MSKPNVHQLPRYLRKDNGGYFLDFPVLTGGVKKRKRVRLGHISQNQALRILSQHLREIVEKRFIPEEKPKISFSEAADAFWAFSKVRKKSWFKDKGFIERLKQFFGTMPLDSLTPGLVDQYLVRRREEGRKKGIEYKGATLNREIACLKTIVRRAMLDRQIDRNPIEGVRLFKEIVRNRTLTPGEFERLIGCCPRHLKPMVQLAYDTAMRRGELLRLRWSQIHFESRVILLEAEDTKTQERREVPLDDRLVKMLQDVLRVPGCPYVFTYHGKPMNSVDTAYVNACINTKITDFRFHDLRHCAVTNMRKAGVNDSTIMSISGHKTHEIFRRYDRIDREDRLNALQKVRGLNDSYKTLSVIQARKPEAIGSMN